jgi:hypothetical protein
MHRLIPLVSPAAFRAVFAAAPREGVAAFSREEEAAMEAARGRYEALIGIAAPARPETWEADRAAWPSLAGCRRFDDDDAADFVAAASGYRPRVVRAFLYLEAVEQVAAGIVPDPQGKFIRRMYDWALC